MKLCSCLYEAIAKCLQENDEHRLILNQQPVFVPDASGSCVCTKLCMHLRFCDMASACGT